MIDSVPWLVLRFLMAFATAAVTHLAVSLVQTVMHWKLGHARTGGRLFVNHVRFHHRHYARGHLVSVAYRSEGGNNTPYFLIPASLVSIAAFLVLPLDLFFVQVAASAASFYAHVVLDREYHVQGYWLARFRWFRRKQAQHFAHHLHPACNFAVIDFFWDRALGTYRAPDPANPN